MKPTLFPNPPALTAADPMCRVRPNARHTDPSTSHEAGRELVRTGRASAQRERCLTAVLRNPGRTAREIEDAIGIKAHKRLPELRDYGLVASRSPRKCRSSGSRAMTWWPVNTQGGE